jgi:hypothetical protein
MDVAKTTAVTGTASSWPELRARPEVPPATTPTDDHVTGVVVTGVVERQRYDDNRDGRVDFRDPSWWTLGSHPVQTVVAAAAVAPPHAPAEIDAARRAYRQAAPILPVGPSGRAQADQPT